MKKTLALLCAIAMLFAFCGCRSSKTETEVIADDDQSSASTENGETNDASDSTESGSQDTSSTTSTDSGSSNAGQQQGNTNVTNPLSPDLKGATIVIYDVASVFAPDASESKTEAAKAEMIKKLQSELNCKITVKKTDADKLASLATASAAGGKAISQIITVPVSRMGFFISSNLVADMGKISSIDLSKDYMNVADMPSASQFGSGKYGVAADGTATACVIYNKRILKELGYSENYIYDLVDSGKWTYEELRKLAKAAMKDLDGKPGMSTADQWGLAVMDRDTGCTADMLVSAKTPMIKLSGGKLVSNMKDAKIAKVANLMRDTFKGDGTVINSSGSQITGTKAHDAFKSGNVFMEYTTSDVMYWYTNMKDEYGLVPIPKFEADGTKNYPSALDWNYKSIMIPAGLSATEQYNAGAVVQAYMYLMQDIYDVKKSEFVNRYLCDDKSGDNLLLAMKGVTMHPVQCYAKINETILTGTYRVFWNYISSGASVSSAVESTSASLQKALDDLNVKIKDK